MRGIHGGRTLQRGRELERRERGKREANSTVDRKRIGKTEKEKGKRKQPRREKKVSEKEHEGGKTDREEERWRKTGRFDNGGNVFGRPGAAFLRSVAALISVVPPALSCQVPLTHNPSAEPGVVTGA